MNLSGITLCEVDTDVYRNVVSLRVSQDLFDDLSDEPEEQLLALHHEMSGKPPLFTSATPVIDRPFEEAEWNHAIGYPFDHWSASRFSDGRFGVWYGADSIATTVFETVYHWRRFLEDAAFQRRGIRQDRRVYEVRCQAALLDLRTALEHYPALCDPLSYHFCQDLGKRIHKEGHPGLLNKSARCEGDCYVILKAGILSNPRALCHLTYELNDHYILVRRAPQQVWMQIPLNGALPITLL